VDIGALCEAIRAAAARIETFPMAGIRVRATRVDHVAMADGDGRHGFIDLSVRLREGRSEDVKRDAIAQIFDTLKTFMAPAMQARSVALSAEMRDINAKLNGILERFRDTGIMNRIAGQDVAGGDGTFQNTSPVDKSLICTVAHDNAANIDKAAMAAQKAFADWRDMPALARKKILIRIAEGIEQSACWSKSPKMRACLPVSSTLSMASETAPERPCANIPRSRPSHLSGNPVPAA